MSLQLRKLIEEYLQCWNPSEAARRAGYSERSVHLQAHRLMHNKEILEYLRERIDELVMSADEAMVRLSKIARAPQMEFITPDGPDLKAIIEAGHADMIHEIRHYSDGTFSIKFHDSKDALKTILQVHERLRLVQDVSLRVNKIEGVEEMLEKVYGKKEDCEETHLPGMDLDLVPAKLSYLLRNN